MVTVESKPTLIWTTASKLKSPSLQKWMLISMNLMWSRREGWQELFQLIKDHRVPSDLLKTSNHLQLWLITKRINCQLLTIRDSHSNIQFKDQYQVYHRRCPRKYCQILYHSFSRLVPVYSAPLAKFRLPRTSKSARDLSLQTQSICKWLA